jgi:transposase
MAFKGIKLMDTWEIIRRYHDGQKKRTIAKALGYDRKTVRKYIKHLESKGVSLDSNTPLEKEQVLQMMREVITNTERTADKQTLFEAYRQEIIDLVTKPPELKLKTAFAVICQRHDLAGKVSYSSFKRFARRYQLDFSPDKTTCRIEVEPASQLQVDYCKLGLRLDPETGKSRVLYAFIATLSYSRHKYVEFTFGQTQQSFVQSHVNAFTFFGGATKTIVPDNLKAGVIKPSLYDPQFNRSYQEMAEYYGCFIDPARVAHPKDKPKVERDVQTIREKYKELIAIDPTATIMDLNRKILDWLRNDYGMKKHGTTHQKPFLVFQEEEQPKLLPLPEQPFEAAIWKEATVHPDHYIQVQKKSYSIPGAYLGKKVWVKVTHNTVEVYFNEQLIKQHPIAKGFRQTDPHDFPENLAVAVDRGFPLFLQNEAAKIGPQFALLIRNILIPHAFMNMRRVQGILTIAKTYPAQLVESAVAELTTGSFYTPKHFKAFMDKTITIKQEEQSNEFFLSQETRLFVRDSSYFDHSSQRN